MNVDKIPDNLISPLCQVKYPLPIRNGADALPKNGESCFHPGEPFVCTYCTFITS